ncbi:MAG: efflux RND transporter periplasmic adaptor subunit [Verrucomicrobia bacterium]|nr:efflux RND transporter periplasmic adaptor subunit [Verrucomicrobiota bacterium]
MLFAEIDLEKYLDGDYQQTLLTTSNDIVSFEQSMKVAKDKMENSKKLYDKGFETQTNLERDQLSFTNVLFSMTKAKESLRLFREYEHPKSVTTFQSKVSDALDDMERVKLEGSGNIAKAEADLASQVNTLLLNSNKLDRLKIQLEKSRITAPQDGLVVYAVSDSRWSSESLVEEGATVRNRQELIKLPDVSQMKVDIKIHESNISQVRQGQIAYIILDPMPDKRFKGYVSKVGVVPEAASRWMGSDMKMYKTEVRIDDRLEGVKPGVSAQVEIITTNLTSVITVPTQCVTTQKDKTVVYRQNASGNAEPVAVTLGVFDDKFIQIVSGIEVGDKIMLNPPLNYDADDLDNSVIRSGEVVDSTPKEIKQPVAPGGGAAGQGAGPGRSGAQPPSPMVRPLPGPQARTELLPIAMPCGNKCSSNLIKMGMDS